MFNYYIDLSERLCQKAKLKEDCSTIRKELFYTNLSALEAKINTDELKKMFWINIYNAYLLIMINEQINTNKIFKRRRIKFSYFVLSLNDIEYGILKNYKYNLGFVKIFDPFYPTFIKKLAIEKFDPSTIEKLNKIF